MADTSQHPLSPALMRGVHVDATARAEIDRTAPPPPLDALVEDIPAITGGNDGTPQKIALTEWPYHLYMALYNIASHLLGHGTRLDHVISHMDSLERGLHRQNVTKPLVLSAIPQRISDMADMRRHLLSYAAAPVANVVIDSGSVKRAISLKAGYTLLDPLGDCTIYTSDGSTADIYLVALDDVAPGQA